MLMMLRDDKVIELFESINDPPKRLETIDIENDEYQFCDLRGQRYVGVVARPAGWFSDGTFELRAEGPAILQNALSLLDQATDLADNQWFQDLASLRRSLARA